MRRTISTLVAAFMAVGLLAIPASAQEDTSLGPIVDAFVEFNNGQYDILVAIVAADPALQEVLNGATSSRKTVLAPDDRAFVRFARELAREGVGETKWWQIRNETQAVSWYAENGLVGSETVRNIVAGHVIDGAAATKDVVFAERRDSFETLNGEIKTYKPRFIKDSSNRWTWVKKADDLVVPDTIVVHRIGKVILPAGSLG